MFDRYLDRVRDLRDDPFFPTNVFHAAYLALFNASEYSDDYILTVRYRGRVLARKTLPFNPESANLIHRTLETLRK